MNWTREDEDRLWKANHGGTLAGALAVASLTAELLATRGGTLTAEVLENCLAQAEDALGIARGSSKVRQHLAVQGAENARLQARAEQLEVALSERTKTYQQAAKERDALREHLADLTEIICGERPIGVVAETTKDTARALREKVAALETSLEDVSDTWRTVERQRDTLRDELARLKPSGQVAEMEASVRLGFRHDLDCPAACPVEEAGSSLSCLAALAQQGQEAVARIKAEAQAMGFEPKWCDPVSRAALSEIVARVASPVPKAHPVANASQRYPCSPTCTHLDAAHPDHPERIASLSAMWAGLPDTPVSADGHERVAERSQAFNEAAGLNSPEPDGEDAADALERLAEEDAHERGAKDMKAACWEAVQRVIQTLALGPTEREMFKAAIEGAAP